MKREIIYVVDYAPVNNTDGTFSQVVIKGSFSNWCEENLKNKYYVKRVIQVEEEA